MTAPVSYLWKNIPFLRLLLPLMTGIIIQWYGQMLVSTWIITIASASILTISFSFIQLFNRFRFAFINGISIHIFFVSVGALLIQQKDIRNDHYWFGNSYKDSTTLLVTLAEQTIEKTKSFKADAQVFYLLKENETISTVGKIIVYFKKDNSLRQLDYGSQIIFKKPLQEIKNSGNPGGFDYKRYSLFHDITHQVYLKPGEFEVLNTKKEKWVTKFLLTIREKVLHILRSNIKNEKELGLAEALLIGYKDDLDQTLVQSYTNTGVVHIIAISGLHLGLIYWLLAFLLRPLQKIKMRWLRPVLIIAGLWLFSLLAGGQPSVLRAALMFTCIVIGESFDRKNNIYNTLAASAFILLCINPYWLWDVGFQLSYAAVLSIIIFFRPIYNWFYSKNKIIDFFWKLNAVTLAAQILTLPISIFHFHQFPLYFFLTNFVAVPLSSIILIGEIILCVISFIPVVAAFTGKILAWLIWLMNMYVERVEAIPFSLWDGLQVNILQTVLLILFITGAGYWLIEKRKNGLKPALIALSGFIILRSYSFIQAENQQKIIIYDVPQKPAIDFVDGRNFFFMGDSSLLKNDFARNFHLKPSRILHRISSANFLPEFSLFNNYITYHSKHIAFLNRSVSFFPLSERFTLDLLVLSDNPKLNMNKLAASMVIGQVVIDGSVPAWKANYWKKDCALLGIPCHDVSTDGAFVMNL